jgi:SRSO17 transposase
MQEGCDNIESIPDAAVPSSIPWSDLVALHTRIGVHFVRSEPRERALSYLSGLLAPLERKNARRLADFAHEARPDGMQRLLTQAKWSCDAVRDEVQDYVKDRIGDVSATLYLAEATFERRGRMSAGVGAHFDPAAGRYVNSQLGLFLGYVRPDRLPTFVDRKLYLPSADLAGPHPDRGSVRQTPPATRASLAQDMVARARRRHLPHRWIAGSVTFGVDTALRLWLECESIPYVLELPPTLKTLSRDDRKSVAARLAELTSAPLGAQWYRPVHARSIVPMFPDEWLQIPLGKATGAGQDRSLLLRRARTSQTVASYLCLAPPHTSLSTLVSVAETGASVETAFQLARSHAGLDRYQVRGEDPWYRHMTLAIAAYAVLATEVLDDRTEPRSPAADAARR